MTDYLTVIEVLTIHADQLDRYGGAPGVRDMGLLEAALFRPQTGIMQISSTKLPRFGRVWRRIIHLSMATSVRPLP